MTITRFIGVDLAWVEGTAARMANETGLVMLDGSGTVLDAGWTKGVPDTAAWIISRADPAGTVAFVDAPLIVDNATGQRACEKQVGQRYGRWKVSANTTNQMSKPKGGSALLALLEEQGWSYSNGRGGPSGDLLVAECYPYTALVGHEALFATVPPRGASKPERPRYKRSPKGMRVAARRPLRADNCDEVVQRLFGLRGETPPLDLSSHPVTAALSEPSPRDDDRAYKHREDLIDAAIAAWTALLWATDVGRCQVLGPGSGDAREATIIAPAVPEQRRT